MFKKNAILNIFFAYPAFYYFYLLDIIMNEGLFSQILKAFR